MATKDDTRCHTPLAHFGLGPFGSGRLQIPDRLRAGFLEDVVIARTLGWDLRATDVRAMLERSVGNAGGLQLLGCEGDTCPYKAYQVRMSLDQLIGVLTPVERAHELQSLLSAIDGSGAFGHVQAYGLTPADLWRPSRCDYFCSVKHWTVMVTLNHLLASSAPQP